MASFLKARTLVNPGRKKRKLSPKQVAIFGTKRQKAALKAARSRKRRVNPSRYSKPKSYPYTSRRGWNTLNRITRGNPRKKRKNPSRILTLSLPKLLSNPKSKRTNKRSKVSNMARTKRRGKVKNYRRRRRVANPYRRVYRRRRHAVSNPALRRRRRHARRNPSVRTVYRTRRHYSRRRRSNPGSRGMGRIGSVGGMLMGAGVTFAIDNFLPVGLRTGFIGYATTVLVAIFSGKTVGRLLSKPALGRDMTTGGFVYLAIKVIGDLFPSVGQYLPFSLKGMGLIAPSSFFVPQVNQAGSMGQFVLPSAVPRMLAAPASLRGVNTPYPYAHNTRRTGRVS